MYDSHDYLQITTHDKGVSTNDVDGSGDVAGVTGGQSLIIVLVGCVACQSCQILTLFHPTVVWMYE